MDNYIQEKMNFSCGKESRIYNLINYTVVDYLNGIFKREDIKIEGSCGRGYWTYHPWIALFNKNITTSAQEGVYIVYLFSKDMERVYLTLNQGSTSIENKYKGKRNKAQRVKEELMYIRNQIRSQIDSRGFLTNNNLIIGNENYEVGSIFYKMYSKEELKNDLISEEELIEDLKNMLIIYDEYYNKFVTTKYNTEEGKQMEKFREKLTVKEQLSNTYKYILSKGYFYTYEDLCNFYLSLKTKPFVILAGISGTGKSKLIRLFAEALNCSDRFYTIPVKPDWNDSTELIGYWNLQNEFVPGKLTKIIYKAVNDRENPYFVCLDEMNLARVEYYLSDFLSIVETRRFNKNRDIITDNIFDENVEKYSHLYFPDNLYIIGTVNMDDTTYSFSRKVLDRANTIEFSHVNLNFLDFSFNDIETVNIDNEFLKTRYINIKDALADDKAYVDKINKKIIEINTILESSNKHFGYRVRDEIVFYMLENYCLKLLDEDVAFDYQLMQKILPTIMGSDYKTKQTLIQLYNFCNPDHQIIESISYIDEAEKNLSFARYKQSAKKIVHMMRGYEDGFTSYWL